MLNTKIIQGKVVKKSSDKTIAVLVQRHDLNKKYKRTVLRSKKYLVHDEGNVAKVGQTVDFQYAKPFSKKKSHVLVCQELGNDSK